MTRSSDPSLWDAEAADFDDAPDHGLLDPAVRDSWRRLLLGVLPPAPADVVDLGCGTGTLALLLAQEGYAVDALDFSPEMVRLARAKLTGAGLTADRCAQIVSGSCDRVEVRHLPDPALWGGPTTDERYVVLGRPTSG